MIAVDTNVLIYACDQADPRRQKIALDLITSAQDGVLLWQVACEFLSASRKLEQAGIHLGARLESPRRVPGSAASCPAHRRQPGARQGAPSHARSVAVGCPDSRGVCRSWRRHLLLRGPAWIRRLRGRPRRQPVQVVAATRGRGGGRCSKARLAPSPTGHPVQRRLVMVRVADCAPLQLLGQRVLGAGSPRQDRAAPCAARRAPQHRCRAEMGRERPRLCIADAAPEPSSGVAHAPRVSV